MNIKFSIVTVCLNAESTIDKTMQSVSEQTYQNFEHIIMDGQSQDTTLEKIEAYSFRYKSGALRVFSKPDGGIYDAMNKSMQYVNGDFVCFMNSGDTFFAKDTLEKVADLIKKHRQYDLYYGGAATTWPNGDIRGQFRRFELWDKMAVQRGQSAILMPCHQAIFASLKCFENNLFDLKYKLRAELNWFIKCVLNHMSMMDVEIPVCRYLYGGTSDLVENIVKAKNEKTEILLESGLCVSICEVDTRKPLTNRATLIESELCKWLALKQDGRQLRDYFNKKKYMNIAIYGYGVLGNFLMNELQNSNIQVQYLIDREQKYELHNIPVYSPNDDLASVDAVVVTAVEYFKEIYELIKEKVSSPIISLDDILEELWYI